MSNYAISLDRPSCHKISLKLYPTGTFSPSTIPLLRLKVLNGTFAVVNRHAHHVCSGVHAPFQVSKLYSKGWAFREEGLTELLQQMRQVEHSPDKEVAKSHMKAAILLVDRALKDKVYSVCVQLLTYNIYTGLANDIR